MQILRDPEIFAKAGQRIRRAYDRQIKKLERKAAEEARAKAEGKSGRAESASGQAGSAISASEVRTEQTHALRQRRDQLLEYVDNMMNLQYLEKFPA